MRLLLNIFTADWLTTVYLWCIVNGKSTKAAAPTGIAAANVEIPRTDVAAATIHSLFDLDVELKTKLDLAKLDHEKVTVGARKYPHSAWLDIEQVYCDMGLFPCDPQVKQLMKLEVLLLDEVSMRVCVCVCIERTHHHHHHIHSGGRHLG